MYVCTYVSFYVGPVMCGICLELLKINLVWKFEPEGNRLGIILERIFTIIECEYI